jgi:hypothetical protein
MTPEQKEKAIIRNMQALKISRKEAEELVEDDEAVDRGEELPWDLTPEQMRNARKAANVTTRKSSGTAAKRVKKENPDKKYIIASLYAGMQKTDNIENLQITNIERSFDFTYNGVNYSVSLTAHRK